MNESYCSLQLLERTIFNYVFLTSDIAAINLHCLIELMNIVLLTCMHFAAYRTTVSLIIDAGTNYLKG